MIQALVKSDKVIFKKSKHAILGYISAVWDQFKLVHSKDSESPYSTGHVKCVSCNSLIQNMIWQEVE